MLLLEFGIRALVLRVLAVLQWVPLAPRGLMVVLPELANLQVAEMPTSRSSVHHASNRSGHALKPLRGTVTRLWRLPKIA